MGGVNGSRRDFIRTTVYVAPAILTLTASPAFAQSGSGRPRNKATKPHYGDNGLGNGVDPQPPGNPPPNDGAGTTPGNPGNRGGGGGGNNGVGNGVDPQPRGNPPPNDGAATSPGNPGGRGGGGRRGGR